MEDKDLCRTKKVPLYIKTPLVESTALSQRAGIPVYLKLECVQPVHSFKLRGISNLCQKAVSKGCKQFVCSSGGNAGLAAAFSARKLSVAATICVPETTPQMMIDILRNEGATVHVLGINWDAANKKALEMSKEEGVTFVHPFDHPDIWEGHASIVKEIAAEIPQKPGAIVVSVGGGGLFNGIVHGLQDIGWNDVPVVAMETVGADCFNLTLQAGKIVTISDIASIAKTLGARAVSKQTFNLSQKHPVLSEVVSDYAAVSACLSFADDHHILVEPSCGATLSFIYSDIVQKFLAFGSISKTSPIVLIVCGGAGVNRQLLKSWAEQVGC